MTETMGVRDRFGLVADGVVAGSELSWRNLELLVGGVAAERDAGDVAWMRLGLSRLMADDLSPDGRRRVLALDAVLEGAEHQLDAVRARQRREEDRRTVRERVMEALAETGPLRPRDLAERCDADVYQVSRALRDLRDTSHVEVVPAPAGETDRRGVWYRRAPRALQIVVRRGPPHVRGVAVHVRVQGVAIWAPSSMPTFVDAARSLARLSQVWLHLLLEQGLPRWALLRNGAMPRDLERIDVVPDAFVETHDLARILGMVSREPVWLSREGHRFWILTRSTKTSAPVDAVMAELTALGEALLATVRASEPARAPELAATWRDRAERSIEQRMAIATGISVSDLAEIAAGDDASTFWELDGDPGQLSEIAAAAQMSAALSPPDIAALLRPIRSCGRVETDELDALAALAVGVVEERSRPFEQGLLLAGWLRRQLGLEEGYPRVDPADLLATWGVPIETVTSHRSIDAIACWGPRHGPMVALNEVGGHSELEHGRRATLAHEIAHLLVDRNGALPLAEVLGGRAAPDAEARARAFAVELLLPQRQAAAVMAQAHGILEGVETLVETYGVSTEVVAWQVRNSDFRLSPEAHAILQRFVTQSFRF